MATFTPGHLHVSRVTLQESDHSYDLNLQYEVDKDPSKGKGIRFSLQGQIQHKEVKESFFLPREEAFNFTRDLSKIFAKYGVPKEQQIQVHVNNPMYDKVFEDIREKLAVHSGDAIDLKDFE